MDAKAAGGVELPAVQNSENTSRKLDAGPHKNYLHWHFLRQNCIINMTRCSDLLMHRKAILMNSDAHRQPHLPGFAPTALDVAPIQTTFRGGKAEPLHLWYPYLEGYSPQFVEAIISHYAPEAETVLDPFSGSGTTPLTASRLGKRAFYCEVNPLMQFLTAVKIKVHALGSSQRTEIEAELARYAEQWEKMLRVANPDIALQENYRKVFGNSEFFDSATFQNVLAARTVIDAVYRTDELLGELLTVAVLASLLPSSQMVRSGDIRYRNERELARRVSFIEETQRRLVMMKEDIPRLSSPPRYNPEFVCADARKLKSVPPLSLDLVVTSPPYLNGTNYFRNTKIELWFLRRLQTKRDLAQYRFHAVTAGINNVTVDKVSSYIPKPVAAVLEQLEEGAYDSRIPLMVLGYFQDMEVIFAGIRPHLRAGALVAVDIGDSVYAGVHVETDKILTEIVSNLGYVFEDRVLLRERTSRDRRIRTEQVLLVFRSKESRSPSTRGFSVSEGDSWVAKWKTFKAELPHQNPPFSKRNWGNSLHSLCSYQGKMKPALAHHLVHTFLPVGGRMLDPFSGVGTIPFEAALSGIKTYGFDISPFAFAVSSAKLGIWNAQECQQAIQQLEHLFHTAEPSELEYELAANMGFNGRIPEYFHPETLREILLARRHFVANPPNTPSEHLVFSSLLHILHGNRPYALSRRSHPITPYKPTGPTEYRSLISRLRQKVRSSLQAGYPKAFVPGSVYFQDATEEWPQEVNRLDAIVTSPPFFDSTRFHMGNWMRLWFCGWEREDFNTKPRIFVDERQKMSFDVYVPVFRQARERLRQGGVFVLHLGKSRKSDMAQALAGIAEEWFTVEDIWTEDVTHLESHGIRDKGTVTGHQYLILS